MKYKYHYIYKTTNLINGKIYIGKRSSNKLCEEDRYLGSGLIFKRSLKKNGRDNFKKELLEYCDEFDVFDREIYWIEKLDSTNFKIGYNITKGGQGRLGFKHSEEEKKRNSERMLEYYRTHVHPWKGKKNHYTSKRNKLMCSKPVLQFSKNGDFIDRWSSAKEARRQTKINNITFCCDVKLENYNTVGGYIWMWEEDYIEEWLKERVYFAKNKYRNFKGVAGKDNPESKAVAKLDKETGDVLDIFDTVTEAAKSVNSSRDNVGAVCRGRQKTAKGFKWKFVKDLEKSYI